MLRLTEIQNRLKECEQGVFQKICNELLTYNGYLPYKLTGSVIGSNKTRKGTPDSVYYKREDGTYIYVEITTEQGNLSKKIINDVEKCLKKITENPNLENKIFKILFLHNQENVDESIAENIKQFCGEIKFEIYGIDSISLLLQTKFPQVAISELGMRDEFNVIENISDSSLEKIANAVSEKQIKQYENNTVKDIKERINGLYKEASSIINTNDSLVYIGLDDKKKLEEIFNCLEAFDFYYKNLNDNDTKLYYHNMLVIISKFNLDKAIEYYNNMPIDEQNDLINIHLYSMILIENDCLASAREILEDLYLKKGYNDAFESLIRVYFLTKDYDKVISLLSEQKISEFDRYGFLASMFIISKSQKRKLLESEIMKLNNKFRKMPLFYICTAKILYDLNHKSKKYKDQFKKGIKLLYETDVIAIVTMCDQAIEIGLEEDAINFLSNIKLTPVLQNKLIELISRKDKLTMQDIALIEKINKKEIPQNIDINYLDAKVLETKGKELEAIRYYQNSFENTKNINSGIKYIQLSIKNRSRIKNELVADFAKFNTVETLMLVAEAYQYMGKVNEALESSYKAIYLSRNNKQNKNIFIQFWNIVIFNRCEFESPKNISCDCVVVIKDDNDKKKIVLLEDDLYFEVGRKILGAEIIRTSSTEGTDLLHLSVGDNLVVNNKRFVVIEILFKYSYFAQKSAKYIEENKNIKTLTSSEDNPEEIVSKIKKEIMDKNKSLNQLLDFYQNEKNLPLSALINYEKSFEDYVRLINTLLTDNERVLLTGETHDLDLNNGFIINQSSLIVLTICGMLDIIPYDMCQKIYITKSLKNKFDYFYQTLLRKSEDKDSELYLNDNNLAFLETPVIQKIQFWKKLNNYINKFTVVEIEAEKDSLYNEKTESIFDKVEFDLIVLAKTKNLPFICDDLLMRNISNSYQVKHTNTMQIIKFFSKDYKTYLDTFIAFSKRNYIYTLYDNELVEMINNLYKNFTEQNKKDFLSVISSVLENKVSFNYYAPQLRKISDKLRKMQYINIFGYIYENSLATFYIKEVGNILTKKSKQFEL